MTERDDAELVLATRNGERAAYGELVTRYQGHVYGLAYSLVGEWASAQDIAQETFIRAFSNLDQLREPAKFAAWLRRVAFGVAMNWLRAFRPQLHAKLDGQVDLDRLDVPDFRPEPPELAAKRELADAVLGAVGALPPKYRVPLTMFHLDGLSYRKVADFLDIPLGTAKSLIHRARRQLRSLLGAYAEEVSPMVQEVFNEHKLPDEFAERVLEGVPALSWDSGKGCTFIGALEAALAVTEHPHSYTDLMGWSGLAFRIRWYRGDDGALGCPSAAVGEFPEEMRRVEEAIGLRAERGFDDSLSMEPFKGRIAGSIDAGLPVIVYEPGWNCAVAYGYREAGDTLVLRDYFAREGRRDAQPADLPAFQYHIRGFGQPMAPREAFLEALRYAVYHWQCLAIRREQPGGTYHYGPAGYGKWREVIEKLPGLPEDERNGLEGAMGFVFVSLVDARRAAVSFLRDHADLLDGHARECVERAADVYKRMADALSAADWDDRAARTPLLEEAERLDGEAVSEIGIVLGAAGG